MHTFEVMMYVYIIVCNKVVLVCLVDCVYLLILINITIDICSHPAVTVLWRVPLIAIVTGDNLIIGSYDKRLTWFDMDLSSKPYKVLR